MQVLIHHLGIKLQGQGKADVGLAPPGLGARAGFDTAPIDSLAHPAPSIASPPAQQHPQWHSTAPLASLVLGTQAHGHTGTRAHGRTRGKRNFYFFSPSPNN